MANRLIMVHLYLNIRLGVQENFLQRLILDSYNRLLSIGVSLDALA